MIALSGQSQHPAIQIISFRKKLVATSGQFGRPSSQYRNFGFAIASALVTKGNPFLPLAISMLRLFGNEAAHSRRSPLLHMVRRFPL
jgi:hypothetical protein